MLAPDTILQNRYRIVRLLSQGGMGAVYQAVDQRLDAVVALKETFFSDEALRNQFEREARLLANLHHPALPRVSDHFTEGDGQFLVMQFIPGDDLAVILDRKGEAIPQEDVLRWGDQLLDSLDYLHTQEPQIIHRDIKPQNLKLTARGQIILLDFGLAKGNVGQISRVTTSGSIFGYTPTYASLEQIQGTGTDPRSDLYSLAATLYHLITYLPPPDALTRATAIVNGEDEPLRPANEVNARVNAAVAATLSQAMALRRVERPASATEMRSTLQNAINSITSVSPQNQGKVIVAPTVAAPYPVHDSRPSPSTLVASPPEYRPAEIDLQTPVTPPARSRKSNRMFLLIAGVLSLLIIIAVAGFIVKQNSNTMSNRNSASSSTRAEIMFGRQTDNVSPANLSTKYLERILTVEGVEAAVPIIRYAVQSSSGFGTEQIEGLDWTPYAAMNGLTLITGRGPENGDEVIVDEIKARENKISVGDQLKLFDRPFRVTGIYASEFGARIKIPLNTMQQELGAEGKCTYILIKCRNAAEQVNVAQRLNAELPGNLIQFTRDVIK